MIDSMLIISTSDTEEHSKPVVDEAVEAAFQLSGFTGLSFQAGTCNRIADYFAHGVARTPNNLRGHVQRINEHIRQKDSPGTYGALLDLFITLSDKGLHLRNRMLRSAKEILDPYRYHIMSEQQLYHVGAASFDRERGLFYLFEPLGDGDKPLVHVWRVN